jgi:hypothetical protein
VQQQPKGNACCSTEVSREILLRCICYVGMGVVSQDCRRVCSCGSCWITAQLQRFRATLTAFNAVAGNSCVSSTRFA